MEVRWGRMMATTSKIDQLPMFAKESDMAASAAAWLKSCGMTVKSEFVTPWGMCDLVGLRFNPKNIAHRLQQKQTRSLGSITQAALLLQIPDIESNEWTTLSRLIRRHAPAIPGDILSEEINHLISYRFVVPSHGGRLQKVNGWLPLQDQLIALELKRFRIDEAMRQALNNLGFADESYVGFPIEVAERIAANLSRWQVFFNAGIGLLSVDKRECKVLVAARKTYDYTDKAIQLYCVEKFWRTRAKDS
jgi:hypothetical protein